VDIKTQIIKEIRAINGITAHNFYPLI